MVTNVIDINLIVNDEGEIEPIGLSPNLGEREFRMVITWNKSAGNAQSMLSQFRTLPFSYMYYPWQSSGIYDLYDDYSNPIGKVYLTIPDEKVMVIVIITDIKTVKYSEFKVVLDKAETPEILNYNVIVSFKGQEPQSYNISASEKDTAWLVLV